MQLGYLFSHSHGFRFDLSLRILFVVLGRTATRLARIQAGCPPGYVRPTFPFTRRADQRPTGHDFLTAQPVTNAAIFLLRNILHDWSDKYCVQILAHLRAAATASTRLVVVEQLVSHVCVDDDLARIPGAAVHAPPAPLLPNGGYASAVPHYMDISMMELFNANERTVREFQALFDRSGWRLVQVVQDNGIVTSKLIGVPA